MYAERPRLGALGSIAQELARLFIIEVGGDGRGGQLIPFLARFFLSPLGLTSFGIFVVVRLLIEGLPCHICLCER